MLTFSFMNNKITHNIPKVNKWGGLFLENEWWRYCFQYNKQITLTLPSWHLFPCFLTSFPFYFPTILVLTQNNTIRVRYYYSYGYFFLFASKSKLQTFIRHLINFHSFQLFFNSFQNIRYEETKKPEYKRADKNEIRFQRKKMKLPTLKNYKSMTSLEKCKLIRS